MFFMFLTATTGAHLIARAAYRQEISDVVLSKEVSGEEWKYREEPHAG
jgi:multisubunit Na+/H+ antiporter MnhG subunit